MVYRSKVAHSLPGVWFPPCREGTNSRVVLEAASSCRICSSGDDCKGADLGDGSHNLFVPRIEEMVDGPND
jgi:hypothetical protein